MKIGKVYPSIHKTHVLLLINQQQIVLFWLRI